MAYLKPVRNFCDEDRCARSATHELWSRNNVYYAKYCDQHGKARLAALQADEERKWGQPEKPESET